MVYLLFMCYIIVLYVVSYKLVLYLYFMYYTCLHWYIHFICVIKLLLCFNLQLLFLLVNQWQYNTYQYNFSIVRPIKFGKLYILICIKHTWKNRYICHYWLKLDNHLTLYPLFPSSPVTIYNRRPCNSTYLPFSSSCHKCKGIILSMYVIKMIPYCHLIMLKIVDVCITFIGFLLIFCHIRLWIQRTFSYTAYISWSLGKFIRQC